MNLPAHRRPRPLGQGSTGPEGDYIYEASTPFEDTSLIVVRNTPPEEHALVEPVESMMLTDYEAALARTQTAWRKVWP